MEEAEVRICVCGHTDAGRKRKNNEDALLVFDVSERKVVPPGVITELSDTRAMLLAVSDGMGGANAGEVASAITIGTLQAAMPDALFEFAPYAALDHAVHVAHQRVVEAAAEPSRHGMGATLTAALVRPPVALIAEVGDSRAYVLRGGELVQLTRDQSQLQALIDKGMTAEEAARIVPRNMILQAVGQSDVLEVVTSRLELRQDDLLLLCSDGLTTEVPDAEIKAILRTRASIDLLGQLLIEAAKNHGGKDNITVILASFSGDAFPIAREGERVRDTFKGVYPVAPPTA